MYIPKKYAIMNTLPTNVLYDIYWPKTDGFVIFLRWSSINARQMLSVSRATIVLPCMAMTDKSESLSVVIVHLNQVWSLRRQENDLSVSVLPIGKAARIFSSSHMLGKRIPSAWLAIMDATDGFIWHSFLPLPMIRPTKQLTFKRRTKRMDMLPCLFQAVEKASYSVFIFFADCLWHEGTQLIMSSLFVAETGLQFR